MAVSQAKHIVASFCMVHDGQLVTHCARWHKQSGFLAYKTGRQFLQPVYGWVIPIYVIPHLGGCHRLTHFLRWQSYSITSDIYHPNTPPNSCSSFSQFR